MLDKIGGGTFAAPSLIDTGAGEVEPTGDPLDLNIQGPGFFSVDQNGQQRLTRNGSFAIDNAGNLMLNDDSHAKVLDASGKPIVLNGTLRNVTVISSNGTITQANTPVAKVGVFNVDDASQLKKEGGTLFSVKDPSTIKPSSTLVQSGFIEKSNVEPATELTQLMDTQWQLEANANMIRYQDQTLSELVNTVGKVS